MKAGQRLDGRFLLERRLGQGGMGEVWAGRDERLRRPIAVKIIKADLGGRPGVVARMLREAQAAARLQHPNITAVHDVGEHDGRPFIVMELLRGRDLRTAMQGQQGGAPVGWAVGVAAQVADGLAHAHEQGVVHRDIKPENVMLTGDDRVKICDFGIAHLVEAATQLTRTNFQMGTPAYMAPEQWKGGQVGSYTDLYALGCTLYELLAGIPPFSGSHQALQHQHLNVIPSGLSTLRTDIPPDLDALVLELLAKPPDRRPVDALAVTARLKIPPQDDLQEPPARDSEAAGRERLLEQAREVDYLLRAIIKILKPTIQDLSLAAEHYGRYGSIVQQMRKSPPSSTDAVPPFPGKIPEQLNVVHGLTGLLLAHVKDLDKEPNYDQLVLKDRGMFELSSDDRELLALRYTELCAYVAGVRASHHKSSGKQLEVGHDVQHWWGSTLRDQVSTMERLERQVTGFAERWSKISGLHSS